MQLGINSNIERMGKTLHVQTEDSGREYGHVITHLFISGSIIASLRASYTSDFSETKINELIKSQHQKMIHQVSLGEYDKKLVLAKPKPKQSSIPLARSKKSQKSKESVSIPSNEVTKKADTQSVSTAPLYAGGPWARPRLKHNIDSTSPLQSQTSSEEDE